MCRTHRFPLPPLVAMIPALALATRSLRSTLGDELLRRIITGALAPGTLVNETHLARELGVSQTPVREAMLSLEGTGLLRTEPRRGFRVTALSIEEASELYALVGHLEHWGLVRRRVPPHDTLAQLDEINRRLSQPRLSVEEAVAIDTEWHSVLLFDPLQPRLADVLGRLKYSVQRYEHVYFSATDRTRTAVTQHREIVTLLRDRKVKRAAALLEDNWLVGIPALREVLRDRAADHIAS